MADDAPRVPSAWQLERAVSTWQQLRALYEADELLLDDEQVIAMALAGAEIPHPDVLLGRVIDACAWADRRDAEADALRAQMILRRDRYRARAEHLRTVILELLTVLEKSSHAGKLAQAVIGHAAAAVRITNADKLPAEYVHAETVRTPDKKLLREHLQAGVIIEGAELSNPQPYVALRGL